MTRRSVWGAVGAALGLLSACGTGSGSAVGQVRTWLAGRPWVASVDEVTMLGGPVPLPSPVQVYAKVTAREGLDRAGLEAAMAEVVTYAGEHKARLRGLGVTVTFSGGTVPMNSTAERNRIMLGLFDQATADTPVAAVHLFDISPTQVQVALRGAEDVLARAERLTAAPPVAGEQQTEFTVSGGGSNIVAPRGGAERVRLAAAVVNAARSADGSAGGSPAFAVRAIDPVLRVSLQVARRSQVAPTFTAVRERWPATEVALTVTGERLAVSGEDVSPARLPTAAAIADTPGVRTVTVQDTPALEVRLEQATDAGPVSAAIARNPAAAGDGTVLVLQGQAEVKLEGTPAEIGAWGPLAGAASWPERRGVEAKAATIRLTLRTEDPARWPALVGDLRRVGWPGTLTFEVSNAGRAGTGAFRYRSTARGKAQDPARLGAGGSGDEPMQGWVAAWDATATD